MICLAVLFSRVQLEGNTEVTAEGEFAIEVTQVCQNAHQHHIFSTVTELVSSALATEAEREGMRGVTFGITLTKGKFRI